MTEQRTAVSNKVGYVGAARCDICECMRPECLEMPLGFFGVIKTTICRTCLEISQQLFLPKDLR